MMIISSREFRDQQKKYFDLVDQNEQVIGLVESIRKTGSSIKSLKRE